MLEDLAAKVEDLEAAVREKESTRRALRDAFSQVAGEHHKLRKESLQQGDTLRWVTPLGYLVSHSFCHTQSCSYIEASAGALM